MAIKVNNVTVIDDSRNATVVNASANSLTYSGTNVLATAAEINQLDGLTDNIQSQLDGSAAIVGTLDRTFTSGETVSLSLSESVPTPIVSVIKEVPQTGVTSNDWDVASDGANYTLHDTSYDTTLTPSNATGNGTFTLGTGSFASTDVGKRIVGNGGEAILTATNGSYELQTAFNDSSTIAAGDWSMFALDVESAAAGLTLSGFSENIFNLETEGADNISFDTSGQDGLSVGITFNNDGTKMFVSGLQNDSVYQYTLSTAFDLNTASYDSVSFDTSNETDSPYKCVFNNTGTKMYILSPSDDRIHQYSLSTAFDISTVSYDVVSFDISNQESGSNSFGADFNNDGTKMYIIGTTNNTVFQYTLSTEFDVGTASYDNISFDASGQDGDMRDILFNDQGDQMFLMSRGGSTVHQYTLSTEFDVGTASYDNISFDSSEQITSLPGSPFGMHIDFDSAKLYLITTGSNNLFQYTVEETFNFTPTSANHTAITTASIDTEFWTDINSMTADDSVNDGAVYYAVSTDDRTTWSIIDDTEGVRNIVRNNGGTWEVNDASDYSTETWVAATENDEFYALEEAVDVNTAQSVERFAPVDQWSYDNVSFDASGQSTDIQDTTFNNDGTKVYIVDTTNNTVFQYSLSIDFDISTASYDSLSFDASSQATVLTGVIFNNNGTKMYLSDRGNDSIFQYSLSSAFDISTATYDNVSFSVLSEDANLQSIAFNNDGTKLFSYGASNTSFYQYSLSTAFDLSTISYDSVFFDISAQGGFGIAFNDDGSKLYSVAISSNNVYQYSLSSPFDLSTISYDGLSFSVDAQIQTVVSIRFNNTGDKVYISDNSGDIYQYTSSLTTSTNRMDATQLNAVSDANHYTLGNDLDLAITLFMADGNTNSPTSDGVAINYDANVLNQGAVLGTDYEFDAPAGDTVRITALSDENFKVKVI